MPFTPERSLPAATLPPLADQTSLPILLKDLRRRWFVATAVTAAVFAGGVAYAESLPNQYGSTAVVSFAPKPDTNAGADTVRLVMPKYLAYARARPTVNAVAERIGEQSSVLARAVDAAVAPDSGNLAITVELPTASRAAEAANALTQEVLDFAGVDELLDAVPVAAALPSGTPSGPPRRLFELAALLVGLLAGATVALLLERGRPRLRTWRDIAVVTGYAVVGRIPASRRMRDSSLDATADPALGAALRTLRTNLERMSRERPTQVLAVTSSLPSEGKTTIAGALAVTLTRLDARVLLLDADLRRPGMHRLFRIDQAPGLHNVLLGTAELGEAARQGPIDRLSLLPTNADPNAGDLLARNLAGVLRQARVDYDVVIVDCPPVLVGDDARTIATLCDGVLFVVAVDSLANVVAEAVGVLDSLDVNVLGSVANRTRDSKGLGSYGSYGSYGAVEAAPAADG